MMYLTNGEITVPFNKMNDLLVYKQDRDNYFVKILTTENEEIVFMSNVIDDSETLIEVLDSFDINEYRTINVHDLERVYSAFTRK